MSKEKINISEDEVREEFEMVLKESDRLLKLNPYVFFPAIQSLIDEYCDIINIDADLVYKKMVKMHEAVCNIKEVEEDGDHDGSLTDKD